ncbi:tRNA-guanine transglycosylase, partial [Patescibacteria group bacterium]|nr:tRNA-guanine transglycosylase [Patescibacteria group bacterium]
MTFFEITHKDKNTRARCGVMHTDHGDIETPVFMPVGTQASVKTLDSNDLDTIGAQIILGNNYHLHLRPGEDLIAEMGGLHKFMNWNKPILTDSGGFQVFSLGFKKEQGIKNKEKNNDHEQGRLVQIDEDGVAFKSHIDGSKHRFTPESATEMQHKIGADIIMAFDECTPDEAPEEYAREAMERTHRWAERSLNEHRRQLNTVIPPTKYGGIHGADTDSPDPCRRGNGNYQRYLFGIIQGANYKHLREESAKYISSLDFDGIAVGGESIGYNMEATKNIMDWIYPYLPENKPCYTMGVGLNPADLIKA